MTVNTILKEMKSVPASRLEEIYQFVHSLTPSATKNKEGIRKKILSFGGVFRNMSARDYSEFVSHTKKARINLIDRKISL